MKKIIIWDFDGVIVDSMQIRLNAFKFALEGFEFEIVEDLLEHHKVNGGISRYVKFERIINKFPDASLKLEYLLERYSRYIEANLFDERILNYPIINTIKVLYQFGFDQYIASGSDESELRKLVDHFGIVNLFKGVYGSPRPKPDIIGSIIENEDLQLFHYLMIGDTINDLEAAELNGIKFLKYTVEKGLSDERIFD